MTYQAAKHTNNEPKYDMKSELNMKAACKCLHEALAEGAAPTVKERCTATIDEYLAYENEKCRK